MKTRKLYIIIELTTDKIVHQTSDRFESIKVLDTLKKANAKVVAQCIYQ